MPNGTHEVERVQREFNEVYHHMIDLYRHAACLWTVITHEGYIALTNPHWEEALGYPHDKLHFRSFYALVAQSEHDRLISQLSNLDHTTSSEQVIHLRHSDGHYLPFLFWFSKWSEKSSGARITYSVGIPLESP